MHNRERPQSHCRKTSFLIGSVLFALVPHAAARPAVAAAKKLPVALLIYELYRRQCPNTSIFALSDMHWNALVGGEVLQEKYVQRSLIKFQLNVYIYT